MVLAPIDREIVGFYLVGLPELNLDPIKPDWPRVHPAVR
jgi:hypothetical protein